MKGRKKACFDPVACAIATEVKTTSGILPCTGEQRPLEKVSRTRMLLG
jgi:hypothetical protein